MLIYFSYVNLLTYIIRPTGHKQTQSDRFKKKKMVHKNYTFEYLCVPTIHRRSKCSVTKKIIKEPT